MAAVMPVNHRLDAMSTAYEGTLDSVPGFTFTFTTHRIVDVGMNDSETDAELIERHNGEDGLTAIQFLFPPG